MIPAIPIQVFDKFVGAMLCRLIISIHLCANFFGLLRSCWLIGCGSSHRCAGKANEKSDKKTDELHWFDPSNYLIIKHLERG